MAIAMTTNARLVAWRKKRGWSQATAAARLRVAQGTWAAWETGAKSPDRDNAIRLERLTGGTIRALAWGTRCAAKTGTDG